MIQFNMSTKYSVDLKTDIELVRVLIIQNIIKATDSQSITRKEVEVTFSENLNTRN